MAERRERGWGGTAKRTTAKECLSALLTHQNIEKKRPVIIISVAKKGIKRCAEVVRMVELLQFSDPLSLRLLVSIDTGIAKRICNTTRRAGKGKVSGTFVVEYI